LSVIPFATSLRRNVLPALGGATIIALCPFPIGATKSIKRVDKMSDLVSNLIHSLGNIGVKSVNWGLFLAFSGSRPSIFSILIRERYLSPSLGGLANPTTLSPLLNENLFI